MPEVFMPRLSDTMQEGTITQWTKKVGDQVEKGDVLAEIETDKAVMELEAYDSGVLEKILVEPGKPVPIGTPIAIIGSGEGLQEPTGDSTTHAAPAEPKADQPAGAAPPTAVRETAAAAASATTGRETATAAPPATEPARETRPAAPPVSPLPADGGRVKASPLARAIAREAGLDLRTVRGSGPGGRVVRADVEAAVAAMRTAPAASPTAAPAAAASQPDVEEIPLNTIRKITARRLTESMQQAPHFYLTRTLNAEPLIDVRARLNAALSSADPDTAKISLNDLIVKVAAAALRKHPEVNVSYAGEKLLQHKRIHIGVAVAIPDGLIVPVIRDADTLGIREISQRTRDLATRARQGKLKPDDIGGSTFTISNLGMFGVDQFTAVINPPEAAILAVGAVREVPVVRDGQLAVGKVMTITLSIDHRALDGATAAGFLADLVTLLENPLAALA
ncbi:MAG: pyruvate dehydrogenase complex dihydrolipoamide acetyltransferase [Acidothermus cellulolyticus]|nr:pyruvate dehydrogenase complex dihydrolipoamide acetyltransferase [Acidothermus cellulolyticus]